MTVVTLTLEMIGALGLFLYGMKVLSDGIQRAAGDRLKGALNQMTRSPLAAVLTGLGVTSLVQSSSATTVMVVSFVNAGLLSLIQAVGVIMGANIGTT
ncbi:MAG TPA: Na/Pi symporter, partial [Spirochaetia bacterium]|nr:Na/Pi symporter [Spirochaetia bacterium]